MSRGLAEPTRPQVRPPPGFTYIYFYGTEDGEEVKLGRTQQPLARLRQHENNAGRHEPLRWLAVLIGTPADEKALKHHFGPFTSRGRSAEWIVAGDFIRDYLRFLRDQPYVAITPDQDLAGLVHVDSCEWLPGEAGRMKVLTQLDLDPALNGDPWADLATSVVMEGDFYTHPDITTAARGAMGDIDLDPASCSDANRGVQAKQFFGFKENGLLHHWHGRIWLNPPYGKWDAWVPKVLHEWNSGRVDQLCALATTRVITAQSFHPLVRSASAIWIGNGRWKFWGPKAGEPDEGHVVFYFGERLSEFREAFEAIGAVYEGKAA